MNPGDHILKPIPACFWRLPGLILLCLFSASVNAHDVSASDASFLAGVEGPAFFPFLYLGAKHMVTGIDHLLFLAGVIFFLRSLKQVALYVSLFALGHSLTLIIGVLSGLQVNAALVDAIIGLSVAYKAFDNLGGFDHLGWAPERRLAVWAFGLIHGLGLATALQELSLQSEGLLVNLVAFNIGVELGQLAALVPMVLVFNALRAHPGFMRWAWVGNVFLLLAGFLLMGWQMSLYFLSAAS